MTPKIAIITVSWGHAAYMPALFASLDKITYPKDRVLMMLLDNQSPDNTYDVVRGLLNEAGTHTKGGVPVALIKSPTNRGFAGGNNDCMRRAMEEGFDYVFLLNPDTEVEPDVLERLVDAAVGADRRVGPDQGEHTGSPLREIGCIQPLMILHPETQLVNSIGNTITYLGMSYCVGYRQKRADIKTFPTDIVSASGAAMFMPTSVLKQVGLFDEALFAYHEDAELSWRIRLAGYRLVLAPQAVIFHKYEFSRSIKKYFWMERNRYWVMFMCYRWPTMLLIFKMLLILEVGMLPFAILKGWWPEKWRVYKSFFSKASWQAMWAGRKRNQALRKVSDREITRTFATTVDYQEVSSPVLRYVGNPIMTIYWKLCRLILWW